MLNPDAWLWETPILTDENSPGITGTVPDCVVPSQPTDGKYLPYTN